MKITVTIEPMPYVLVIDAERLQAALAEYANRLGARKAIRKP